MADKKDRNIAAEPLPASPSEPYAVPTPDPLAEPSTPEPIDLPSEPDTSEVVGPAIFDSASTDPAPLDPPLVQEDARKVLIEEAEVLSEPAPLSDPAPASKPLPSSDPFVAQSPEKPAEKSRSGFVAPLLGGAIAAALGFALSHFNLLQLRPDPNSAALEAQLRDFEGQLASTNQEIAALAQTAAQTGEASAQDEALGQSLTDLSAQVASLQERFAALPSGEGLAQQSEIETLTARLEELARQQAASQPAGLSDAEIRQIIADEVAATAAAVSEKAAADANAAAEAITAEAHRQAAFTALAEAKGNGQPFAAALATLGADLPAAAEFAQSGLPRLSSLQASFVDPAREALAASLRENAQTASMGDRVWSFLRIQSGARSLSPQEGNDPDAVLSRAEAALAQDDLPTVLAEIANLPPAGQAPLAAWVAQAQARLDAVAAIDSLIPAKE